VNAVITEELADAIWNYFNEDESEENTFADILSLYLFKNQCLDIIMMNEKVPYELEDDIKFFWIQLHFLLPNQSH